MARELCSGCYQKHVKAGTIEQYPRRLKPTFDQSLHRARTNETEDGCWLWHTTDSYGFPTTIKHDGRNRGAHVVTWSLVNGPVPPGMIIAHQCGNRGCVRPEHLQLSTRRLQGLKTNRFDLVDAGEL